ncbi:MAG: glycosyltransferase family 2 protein [Planctomycetes bacterium]|nr:glycosyltransferase family 2 protein [Planctomycetota bacterium]
MSAHGAIRSQARPLSVVVPTWNGGPRFLELLDALARQDIEGGFQLVVIDSGSRDGSAEAAERAGALVLRIEQREFQHGRTRNRAIAAAGGSIVCLLTQDAVPMDAGYLAALRSAFDDARIDAAYARQFPRPDCDPILAERLRRWSGARAERVVQQLVLGDAQASRARYEALAPLERLHACSFDNVASAVRRSTWERIPFPELPFGEDVGFAKALLLSGGAIAFEPAARVEHSHRIDLVREFKRLYCDHRNLYEVFGLQQVPSWSAVRAGWAWGRAFYRDLLAGQELRQGERLYWRAYSIPYALLETAAQFLGARSHWKTRESAFWNWFDRRVRRGV